MAETTVENLQNNIAGQDEQRDTRVKDYVMDSVQRVLRARAHLEAKWIVMDRIWRGDPISRYYDVSISTAIPEPYKMVGVTAPRVALALMPDANWFRLEPQREKSVEPVGAKRLMQEQFKDGKLSDRVYRMVQNGAKYGTMIAKVPWRMGRREVTVRQVEDREKYNEDGQLVGSEERTRTDEQTLNRDRTELRPLNIHDFICDWRFDSCQDAPFCADYGGSTKEECIDLLKTNIRGGGTVYQGITEEQINALGVRPRPVQLAGKDIQDQASGADQIEKTAENDIKVLDWWGLLDPDETGARVEYHVIILNDEHVVHISKRNLWHGCRPYLTAPWDPVENELYGIGVIEMIVRLCMDLNDNQNNMNAGTALSVNPMVKAGDGTNIPDDQFTAIPGRVLRMGDPKQLQPFVLPDTSRVGRENKEDIRRDIDETVGAPRNWVAGTEGGEQTATEFSGKQRAANIRLRPVIIRANENIMQPFVDMCLYNNQQFLEEERTVTYTGNAGQYFRYKVTPKELAGIARVEALLPQQIEFLGLRGQMMMTFMNTVAALGEAAAMEPFRSMLKISYINQFGYQDADKIWPEEVERWRVPQREEILVMLKGVIVDVHEDDNHAAHIRDMVAFMQTEAFRKLSPEIRAILNAHYMNHEQLFRLQEEEMAQLPSPEAMEGAAMGAEGGPMGIPEPGAAGAALEGVLEGRPLAEEQRMTQQGT
jgi:hypothetical protein